MEVQKYRLVILAVLFALAVIAAFGVYDFFVLDVSWHKEGPPKTTPYHLFRGAAAALAAVLMVAAILATGSGDRPLPAAEISATERGVILGIAGVSLATLVLFYVDADLFSQVSSEDGVVESVSTLALFAAAICLCVRAVLSLRGGDSITAVAFGFLALGCFVVGMEEISWGQRLIGFDSPDVFMKYNRQDEVNLHNLSSDFAENVYYGGAVLFLIVLPFLHDVSPLVSQDHPLSSVLPERKVIFASALVAAYNWDMWRVIPIQMGFYVTVLILLYYLIQGAHAKAGAKTGTGTGTRAEAEANATVRAGAGDLAMIVLITFAVVANQMSFLIGGDRQSWTWATTEYKELFIPMGLLFYAVSVLARGRAQARRGHAEATRPAE